MASGAGPQRLAPDPSRSGARFGKYRLIRELAIGGMAKIYLAAIDGPGGFSKTCVIKRILPEHSHYEEFARMFVTEARVAALLSHPHIVQVFDFGQVGNEYYIAMEWVDGASLEMLLQRAFQQNTVPGVRIATRIALPLCSALAYAHAAKLPDGPALNLVHRDLTPGNVLLAHNGTVKLTDFGVAKVSLSHDRTNAGVVKGKFAYMAPEQVRGDPIDRRSDIFALGIILFEVATGKWLFRRAQLAEVITAVSRGEVPSPSSVSPDIPKEFEKIVMHALAPHPDDRYPTARDMLNDLEAFQNKQQWTANARELVALMQKLLPAPDPARADPAPLPQLPQPAVVPELAPSNARMVEEITDPVAAPDHPREPGHWWTWVLVGVGVAATVALWSALLG